MISPASYASNLLKISVEAGLAKGRINPWLLIYKARKAYELSPSSETANLYADVLEKDLNSRKNGNSLSGHAFCKRISEISELRIEAEDNKNAGNPGPTKEQKEGTSDENTDFNINLIYNSSDKKSDNSDEMIGRLAAYIWGTRVGLIEEKSSLNVDSGVQPSKKDVYQSLQSQKQEELISPLPGDDLIKKYEAEALAKKSMEEKPKEPYERKVMTQAKERRNGYTEILKKYAMGELKDDTTVIAGNLGMKSWEFFNKAAGVICSSRYATKEGDEPNIVYPWNPMLAASTLDMKTAVDILENGRNNGQGNDEIASEIRKMINVYDITPEQVAELDLLAKYVKEGGENESELLKQLGYREDELFLRAAAVRTGLEAAVPWNYRLIKASHTDNMDRIKGNIEVWNMLGKDEGYIASEILRTSGYNITKSQLDDLYRELGYSPLETAGETEKGHDVLQPRPEPELKLESEPESRSDSESKSRSEPVPEPKKTAKNLNVKESLKYIGDFFNELADLPESDPLEALERYVKLKDKQGKDGWGVVAGAHLLYKLDPSDDNKELYKSAQFRRKQLKQEKAKNKKISQKGKETSLNTFMSLSSSKINDSMVGGNKMSFKEYAARKLKENVKTGLSENKKGRYLAVKSSLLNILDPTHESSDMAAQAYMRFYNNHEKYKSMEKYIDRLSKRPKKDRYNTQINLLRSEVHKNIQWDVKPTKQTAELARVLAHTTTNDIGANYSAGLAFARLYDSMPETANDTKYLDKAYRFIEKASELSGRSLEWVESARTWTRDMVRNAVHRGIQWNAKPSKDMVGLALLKLQYDDDRVSSLYSAALALGQLYHATDAKKRNVRELATAQRHIKEASDLSGGNLTWVESARQWLGDEIPRTKKL